MAVEILVGRQKKAEALKKLTDVAVRMSEEQLVELRADIKVSFSLRSRLTQPAPELARARWCSPGRLLEGDESPARAAATGLISLACRAAGACTPH